MNKALYLLALALIGSIASSGATVLPTTAAASANAVPGGDPRIQLCGKLAGDVTKADWQNATEVKLVGCVPGTRIAYLQVCIKDCVGNSEFLKNVNGTLTPAMKMMITNLPAGTPFSVRVAVVDGTGKKWEVPDAAFVWKD